jgi:mRNA interferase MazF
MTEGDVVLTPLPQADGQVRNRPAVVLRIMPPHGDLLVCGVSTQLHHETPGFDEVIRPGDSDFDASGLRAASLIRLGFLVVLPAGGFLGSIGSIAPERHRRLPLRLSEHLVDGREAVLQDYVQAEGRSFILIRFIVRIAHGKERSPNTNMSNPTPHHFYLL